MIARGKREARRPWLSTPKKRQGLKGRNSYYALSGLRPLFLNIDPGATRFALAPGYYIRRLWRWPLAIIFRAFGVVCSIRASHFIDSPTGSCFDQRQIDPDLVRLA
jgi:hypothetical protein